MPTVSVIVPMYKVERYIKICVDSILAQTFKDFEIILVDDASPDRCFELCNELYGGNKKVRIIRHEKNLGLGSARNTGIKNARGKYVYFVDSDDYLLPDALEKFYTAAEKTNAQVVHAAGHYILNQNAEDTFDKGSLALRWDRHSQEGFLPAEAVNRIEKHWKPLNVSSTAWLNFCRRDFLEQNKIEFLPIISEDIPFNFALLCFAERYYILHAAVYVHLLRQGSIMSTHNLKRFEQGIQAMVIGSEYVEKILDTVAPRFKGYDLWRDILMEKFFGIFLDNHTAPYYDDEKIKLDVNNTARKVFAQFFGGKESFVRFFFNNYHFFAQRSETLYKENQQFKIRNNSAQNTTDLNLKQ